MGHSLIGHVAVLRKPKACEGCLAYNWGANYVPDEEDHGQKVIILAQNPGESEEKGRRFLGWSGAGGEKWEATAPAPLIGKSGHDLTNHYLPLSGLQRDNVRCGNVVRCRWKNSNVLPPLTQSGVREIIRHCQQAHFTPPREGQVVVALGAYALWAMTGEFGAEGADEDDDSRASRSIDGWRGWVVPSKQYSEVTIFATYHPAFFYRAHWLKPVGKMDWAKLGRLLKGTWPEPTPHIERTPPDAWPDSLAFDTEYNPATGELHRYSVAWRGDDGLPVVHVVEARDVRLGGIPPRVVIRHNATTDGATLVATNSGKVVQGLREDSTPEVSELGSILSAVLSQASSGTSPTLTFSEGLWYQCRRLLEAGRKAKRAVRDLLAITEEEEQAIHDTCFGSLPHDQQGSWALVQQLQYRARAFSGSVGLVVPSRRVPKIICHSIEADWPYIKSVFGDDPTEWDDTMYAHSALHGTLRHTLDFLGSLYTRTNRWKHLEQSDPIVYSGLDALATWDAWAALAPELGRDPGSRSVYDQELKPLLPHLLRRPSIQLDAVKVAHAVTDLSGQQVVLAEQAHVSAGWPLNVGSPDQVARWVGVKG